MKTTQIKKEQLKVAQARKNIYYLNFANYFWWIANLGVVPLFLFAAFLFCPAFFFLLTLLFLVTFVLDTIIQPLFGLRKPFNLRIRQYLLPGLLLLVNFNSSMALEKDSNVEDLRAIDYSRRIITRIGETKILKLPNLQNFSVSQPDIANGKYIPNKKILVLKGVKLGISQILVWNPTLTTYDLVVIPKKKFDDYTLVSQQMSELNLNTVYLNQKISVSGLIDNEDVYKKVITLSQEHSFSMDKLTLAKNLADEKKLQLIRHLFDHQHLNYSCRLKKIVFECYYPKNDPPRIEEKNELNELYFIKFIKIDKSKSEKKNYILFVKYLEFDNVDEQNFDIGLNSIILTYEEILHESFNQILAKRNIFIDESTVKISKEHTQRLQILLDKDSSFSLGQDNEYKSFKENGQISSNWKFSGLKMNFKLKKEEEQYKLIYSTQSTHKNESESISGAKGKSEIFISPKKPILLFDLNHTSLIKTKIFIPVLGNIPYLGNLFSYQNDHQVIKRFVVYATLEEMFL